MRKQWLFGWLATLDLLISLSVADCIQPITAAGMQTGAVAQAATDEATEALMRRFYAAFNERNLNGLDE